MGDTIYVLGHSQTEIRRLIKQAAIVQTTTEPNPTDEPVAKQSSSRHKGQTEVAGVIFNNQYLPPFRLNSAHNHRRKSTIKLLLQVCQFIKYALECGQDCCFGVLMRWLTS